MGVEKLNNLVGGRTQKRRVFGIRLGLWSILWRW